jgi:apolipoprotein N-acyltransferase
MRGTTGYNALYFFTPDGGLANVYHKRQLVPFVESLPAPQLLGAFPGAALVSRFGSGDSDGILHIGPRIAAPLICWESAFTDLAVDAVRSGADVLLIATDDAWFGTTAGPYQHAQIAQMRAVETGAWVVRAAATGISGIIAPNGRYTAETKLATQDILAGPIGQPLSTLYTRLGSYPVAFAFALIYLAAVFFPKRRTR